jgi:hypothetical protein
MPHVMETRLDATCYAMALTSCFAKIGTFYNVEATIITLLFPPSIVASVIIDTSWAIVVDVPMSIKCPPPAH